MVPSSSALFGAIRSECAVDDPNSLYIRSMERVYAKPGLQDRYQDVSYVMDETYQRVLVCQLVRG